MTEEVLTKKFEEIEEGRPTTSKFRSRRFLRSRNRSREGFAVTMHRFGCTDHTELKEDQSSTMKKEGWLKSNVPNRKSTTPIT